MGAGHEDESQIQETVETPEASIVTAVKEKIAQFDENPVDLMGDVEGQGIERAKELSGMVAEALIAAKVARPTSAEVIKIVEVLREVEKMANAAGYKVLNYVNDSLREAGEIDLFVPSVLEGYNTELRGLDIFRNEHGEVLPMEKDFVGNKEDYLKAKAFFDIYSSYLHSDDPKAKARLRGEVMQMAVSELKTAREKSMNQGTEHIAELNKSLVTVRLPQETARMRGVIERKNSDLKQIRSSKQLGFFGANTYGSYILNQLRHNSSLYDAVRDQIMKE